MSKPADANSSLLPGGGMASGVALVLATVLVWGLQFPIAKSAFEHVDPFNLALVRYTGPVILLLGLLIWREGISSMRFDRQAGLATIIGLIGVTGSPTLVFGGLSLTRPEVAAIIVAIQPSITAIVLWMIRGQRPDGFSLLCIVVAFFGVVTVITGWSMEFASHPTEVVGDVLILAGALCWVTYTIAGEWFSNWSVLRFTSLTMLPGALGHVVLVFTLTWLGYISTPALSQWAEVIWHNVFLALFGVLAAMLMWNAGTKRIGSLNAMLFLNLIPVITFAVRYWQGAQFTVIELAGAAIVVAALIANNLWMRTKVNRQRAQAIAARPAGGVEVS